MRLPGFIPKPGRFRWPSKLLFIISGLLSTVWFLIRVIPKPSRATYPCMRAAAPLMSSFVIYLLGIGASVIAAKRTRFAFRRSGWAGGMASLLVFFIILLTVNSLQPSGSLAIQAADPGAYIPNMPMGAAQGILPGRVVWIHDREATNSSCTNTFNQDGRVDDQDDVYFQDKNTHQEKVDKMLAASMLLISGKEHLPDAWDAVFRWFNLNRKGKGGVPYQQGEIILIKVNRTSVSSGINSDLSRNDQVNYQNLSETSPQIMLALLRQLVEQAGVSQEDIYIGDPHRSLYKEDVDKLSTDFPLVHYLGKNSDHGRTPVIPVSEGRLYFSDPSTITEKTSDGLYDIYEEADYLISLPAMKGHGTGGITVSAKNHFGSQSESSAAYLHPGLVNTGGILRNQYGMYRVLTDILGSKYLGRNTLISIVDALWTGSDWNAAPNRFITPPFENDFTSSLLVSLDEVALESVCFDILRSEYTVENGYQDIFPNYGAVDDYLHQAADRQEWPEGINYDPDHSGTPIPSLGVHEHWNNADQRQYSRNLGLGQGIELIYLDISTSQSDHVYPSASEPAGIPENLILTAWK